MTSHVITFVAGMRNNPDFKRAYIGMLQEIRITLLNAAATSPDWDEFLRRQGRLQQVDSMISEIEREERDAASRRDYEAKSAVRA